VTVNKAFLIESITSHHSLSKNRSAKLINSIIEILKNSLESGEEILISGFGKFVVKQIKDGRSRSPVVHGHVDLQAEKVLRFKCSPVLMQKVNEINNRFP